MKQLFTKIITEFHRGEN